MKVLVTGATGFVGGAVVKALRWRGHTVIGLARDAVKGRALSRQGIETILGDMRTPQTYQPLVRQVDAVIHAAQQPLTGRWSQRQIAAMHASDALMTRSLAWACAQQQKPFLYSSGGLTHRCDGDAWINECSPPNPCQVAVGHADMEEWLAGLHAKHGLRSIILSPGFVYGSGGFLKQTVELLMRRRYCHIGNPRNYWSLVHVDDVGEAYALALERGRGGESYFIGDDAPLRREEIVGRVAESLGLPAVRRVSAWVAGLAFGGAMVEAVTASFRLRNKKARRELGWEPRHAHFRDALPGVLRDLLRRAPLGNAALAPRLTSA